MNKKYNSGNNNNYYRCSESSINDSSDSTCIPGFIDPGYQMEHYTLRIVLTNLSFFLTAFRAFADEQDTQLIP